MLKRTVSTATMMLTGVVSLMSGTAIAQNAAPGMEPIHAQAQQAAAAAAGAQAQAAAPAVPNPNCTLLVPANALTAQGLATPYQLVATDPAQGPCNESNTAQAAFVQGAIFDPATGAISIYNPLVIDKGDRPLAQPVVPVLPAGAIVALWTGFNGTNLTLKSASGTSVADAHCVNGTSGSVFGQYSYCNAPAFFAAANAAVASGQLKVPPLGTAKDGKPCPSVRDFFIVDQDQSDNVTTLYLVSPHGHIAQLTAANKAAHPTATTLGNPSDNRLTDVFVEPALGCKPWTAPDLADAGAQTPALPLNELQARSFQQAPVATIPAGDPMVLVNNNMSLSKDNLYRQGVDQPTADSFNDIDTGRYCRQLLRNAPQRMLANKAALAAFTSPDPAAANSLLTFLAQRFTVTFELLDCAALTNTTDPVSVTLNKAGVAVTANFNTGALNAIVQKLAVTAAADNAKDSFARDQNAMN
jgi:hypothetical protein